MYFKEKTIAKLYAQCFSNVSFYEWGLPFNSSSAYDPESNTETTGAAVTQGLSLFCRRKNFQLLRILNISKWKMFSFLFHYKFSSELPSLCCIFKHCSWEAFKHANRETWFSSLSIRTGTLKLEEKINFALLN